MKKYLYIFLLILAIMSCIRKQQTTNIKNQKQDTIKIETIVSLQLNKLESNILDTIMFRYCDIDGDSKIDTIKTVGYVESDTIFVYYSWMKNNQIIWKEMFKDVLSIFPDSMGRDEWIEYVINNAPPRVFDFDIDEYRYILDFYGEITLSDLKEEGFNVNKEEYEEYVLNFQGNLLDWGHPIYRAGLFIWYEPLNRFVTFYHP